MATGARVVLNPIPMNTTTSGATWLTATTPGYDTGTGSITAWGGALGVIIPNSGGNVFLEFACGATPGGVCQVLVGELIDGVVLPATQRQYTIAATTQGWLGPWSPATVNQRNPTGVTFSGAINTQTLLSNALNSVVIDFTTTTTLAVRARSFSPVQP